MTKDGEHLKNRWLETLLAIASIAATLTTAKAGVFWALYLSLSCLVLSFVLVIWNLGFGLWIQKLRVNFKTERILNKQDSDFWNLLSKTKVIDDFCHVLSNMEWQNVRPHGHPSIHNSVGSLISMAKSLPPSSRIVVTNLMLREIIGTFDHWVYACDQKLHSGALKYSNEDEKNKILRGLKKYEMWVEDHNKKCSHINDLLGEQKLVGIHLYDYNFNWKNADPISQK